MSKKGKDFKAGDFIFAKVKGYPAWPARIRGKNGKKFFVYFYGTGETANLMANVLYDYKDNKDKFLAKPMKRRDFNDGLLQINYEIENNIPLPVEGEEPATAAIAETEDKDGSTAADKSTVADSTMADTTLNETAASSEGDDSKINDSAVNDSAVNDSAVNEITHNDSSLKESVDQEDSDEANPPLVIDEDKKTRKSKAPVTPRVDSKRKTVTPSKAEEETVATPAAGRGRPRAKRAAEDTPVVVATPAKKRRHIEPVTPAEEPEKPAEEPVKESLDEAKTADKVIEEMETQDTEVAETPTEVVENSDVTAEVATPKLNKGGRPKTQYNNVSLGDLSDLKDPFKDVLAEDGKPKQNVLLARLPNQRYVGIKLFQDRPKTFKTPAAKLAWESQMAQNAIDLRHKLETGLIKPIHIPNEIVTELNLSEEDKKNIEKEREIEETRYRLNFLRTEMKLGDLTTKIKCSLGLQKADTKACLAFMDELLTLEIKPLMLYKNHKIVETIKRLRSYVGDTHNWTMTEDELEQFSKDAGRIRKKAEECYQCFKLLFPEPAEGVTFFQQFSMKHGLFHACTKSLSEDDMLELVHEPAEMLDPSNPIQPILDAMNDEDDEEVPKKRRKTTNTPAKSTPAPDTKGKRGRSSKKTTETDVETTDQPSNVKTNLEQKEKEVPEEEDILEDAEPAGDRAPMKVDQASESNNAETSQERSDTTAGEIHDTSTETTEKSNDKGSSNKIASDEHDKASAKAGSRDSSKDKDKHSRSSDKVTDKSVKSRSDDAKHSSSKHSKATSEKDKSTSKSSEKSERSDKSDKTKSDRKSIQEKSDKEDSSSLKRKADDEEKAGTSNSNKDSDKAEDRGDRKRERSSSGVNGTEKDGDTDKSASSTSKKADKIRKSSSSSSHQSDSSKYSSKKKSIK